ncbi:unnamed protein product [Gongylonema pulchrum]|uniref:C-type lectin domain-containing protein n=1 Tax=Gongylonema pulchrum TaxID=637853 RepID=A0A183EMV6_9BILA|nr:unnamed protein product [Gongylonema pulchrum]
MREVVLVVLQLARMTVTDLLGSLNLPEEHIQYWLNRNEALHNFCSQNETCYSKYELNNKQCWGYEASCSKKDSFSARKAKCTKPNSWQKQIFKKQADFAKLAEVLSTITPICVSNYSEGSSLECSSHLRFCRAKNIFFDFHNLNAKNSKRYRNDVIQKGQAGGNCNMLFNEAALRSRADEKSYLQSWAHELEHFSSYPTFEVSKRQCDVIFEKPTVLIKLDAASSMYHHFCDFVNLYASQHVNGSVDMDIDILWWDTVSFLAAASPKPLIIHYARNCERASEPSALATVIANKNCG